MSFKATFSEEEGGDEPGRSLACMSTPKMTCRKMSWAN